MYKFYYSVNESKIVIGLRIVRAYKINVIFIFSFAVNLALILVGMLWKTMSPVRISHYRRVVKNLDLNESSGLICQRNNPFW